MMALNREVIVPDEGYSRNVSCALVFKRWPLYPLQCNFTRILKKGKTIMVNNFTNVNKKNNHISPCAGFRYRLSSLKQQSEKPTYDIFVHVPSQDHRPMCFCCVQLFVVRAVVDLDEESS
jgi:hypothetical protein